VRAFIYDGVMVGLTRSWYASVLARVPAGSKILDVGVGTGGSLVKQADAIRQRDLHIVGVDIDEDYLRTCRARVEQAGLSDRVRALNISVYDFAENGFDAIYFACSFMLLPDPVGALRHVGGLLRPGGRVYFTQTFQERRSPLLEKAKPLLHRLTTIHFGNVTYEADFFRTLDEGGYEVLEHTRMGGGAARSFRLVEAAPRQG
jgi:ubiquinone/menaquinone biosynthesis C-methylase UbiE